MVKQLDGIVSNETLLAQIPFIDDAAAEQEKVQEQQEQEKLNNPFFQSADLGYRTQAMITKNDGLATTE